MTAFSDQCPIFYKGKRGEFVAPIQLSSTVTTEPIMSWTPSRPVIVEQVLLHANNSDGLSSSISTTIQFYTTASTIIGSLAAGTLEMSDNAGTFINSASLISTSLGSTDTLTAYLLNEGGECKPNANYLVVRYRER